MRAILLAIVALASCGPAANDRETKTVLSHGGDPGNFPSGSILKRVYPILNCDFEIRLKAPFEVSEDGWGDRDIRAPLALLDDSSVKSVAAGGVDAQSRVSYAFPSRFRGQGMKEWFASGVMTSTGERPRPLESVRETLKFDGTRFATRYLGVMPGGRELALYCTATDLPNPTCHAELLIGDSGQRYMIIFPPKAVARLSTMVEIGDGLFSEAAAHCPPR